MKPSYDFTVVATPAIPEKWTYRKAIVGAPAVDREKQPELYAFSTQTVVDVEVSFADCDDGVNVEWKVQLKPSASTRASVPYTVKYGYIDKQVLERQGPHRYDMAQQMALQSMSEVFSWREERVQH